MENDTRRGGVQLVCPVCGGELAPEGRSYYCAKRHCFDIAKSGYVNLLPPSGSGRHGDDRVMVRARTEFLSRGCYEPLARRICERAAEFCGSGSVIVDAGCGEGYYSAMAEEASGAELIGIDISKEALIAASRRSRSMRLVAASTAAIPLPDGCADAVLNIFSPLFPEEFSRILRPEGRLIRVVPMERHLYELKELIYDRPYENPAPEEELPGFRTVSTEQVKYTLELHDAESISQLFMMTPYYYKTSREDQQKLAEADELKTAVEFEIIVYEKAGESEELRVKG